MLNDTLVHYYISSSKLAAVADISSGHSKLICQPCHIRTGKMDKWLKFNHFKSTVKDALIKLNDLVDESDPDTELPNIVHAFQTAERIRQDYPDEDWFHLTGLIHDLGKVRLF